MLNVDEVGALAVAFDVSPAAVAQGSLEEQSRATLSERRVLDVANDLHELIVIEIRERGS
jgi:hypothetical protein